MGRDVTMLSRATAKASSLARRSVNVQAKRNLKVLLALYEDPQSGYPPNYARNEIPEVTRYPGITHDYVQTAPTPEGRDFNPGDLLGCVSGELGLRKFLEDRGHTLVVTSDKDGDGCELEQHLPDTDIVMSQPFWPAYIRGANGDGAQPEDVRHLRDWLRPRRLAGGHGAQHHRDRGHILQ